MPDKNFPCIVAIGASAGGLAAFQELIENLPTDTGMAFVLLSHIQRRSKSLLPEILARSTRMHVIQAADGENLVGNHVYVLPPDKFMELEENTLRLSPRPPRGANNAIDHFLYSLAKDSNHESVGIVLSGEGSDGAQGLKVLKEAGGTTIAQAPVTAASKSMPTRAIEIDHIDYVCSPKDIALALGSKSWRASHLTKNGLKIVWLAAAETPATSSE
jgi:two-component system CheB/CheR fusion protein